MLFPFGDGDEQVGAQTEIATRSDNAGFRQETKKALESTLFEMGDKRPNSVRKFTRA